MFQANSRQRDDPTPVFDLVALVKLGIVVAAAILTPPDVISQFLLAVPMIILFEAGLIAARIFERRR